MVFIDGIIWSTRHLAYENLNELWENLGMKKQRYFLFVSLLLILIQPVFAEDDHAHEVNKTPTKNKSSKSYNHSDEGTIEISLEGQQAAGIQTKILKAKPLPIYISAPGEAIPNQDLTYIVTPRIQSQVVQRLVNVGSHVKRGQPLVRLSSVGMSKAQANLLLAQKEWRRLRQLGKQAVSAKRYQTAEITYQQAYSRLLSYGMTRQQVDEFIKSSDPDKAKGDFTLLARRRGTVFSANFTEGQMIQPGKVLYKVVDETSLWVDAMLSNSEPARIKNGSRGIIQTAHYELPGVVIQVHHKLDETTRTRIVRLNVPNPKDQLHPGEFVTCLIQTEKSSPVLAVHQTALVRSSDGDMAVYIEVNPSHFKEKKVQIVRKVGSWNIIKGIEPGERIVTKGAFFVRSESLKSNFSAHNH